MDTLKTLAILCFCFYAMTIASAQNTSSPYKDVHARVDEMKREYIPAQRILWQSDNSGKYIENSDRLLQPGDGQSILINKNLCRLVNREGHAPAILLDFGRELHGGLEIVTGRWDGDKPVKVRVRFGESVSEAMADIGGEKNATNDHAIRDEEILIPWLGKREIGNTGFRFVRIDLIEPGAVLLLKEINAISVSRDIPWLGAFSCNDTLLNKVWQTGAYTVYLNMQDYLWDGIKRDRLVWIGDMHPEVMTICAVFGNNEVVQKSMDLIRDITPLPEWMNTISSYSMWWVIIQAQLYRQTGDLKYLEDQKAYLSELLVRFTSLIEEDGREKLTGKRFLDWPSSEDETAIHAGYQALLKMTLEDGETLCKALGDYNTAKICANAISSLKRYKPEMNSSKQAAALLSLAGYVNPEKAAEEVISVDGAKDFSTFYGYYMLEALAKAGEYETAMNIIREYWGGMLGLGATTFWEDFNLEWAENAYGIDQLPVDGKDDIHGDFGNYCYVGLRHSLCHGWSSGPTAWLSQHVLGIKILAPGCEIIAIEPNLGSLEWVEGSYPTPYGIVSVKHTRQKDGKVVSEIDAPDGIEILFQSLKD